MSGIDTLDMKRKSGEEHANKVTYRGGTSPRKWVIKVYKIVNILNC